MSILLRVLDGCPSGLLLLLTASDTFHLSPHMGVLTPDAISISLTRSANDEVMLCTAEPPSTESVWYVLSEKEQPCFRPLQWSHDFHHDVASLETVQFFSTALHRLHHLESGISVGTTIEAMAIPAHHYNKLHLTVEMPYCQRPRMRMLTEWGPQPQWCACPVSQYRQNISKGEQ